jgi:hypothetical protein
VQVFSPRNRSLFAAVCALAVLATACGGGSSKKTSSTTDTTLPTRKVRALTLGAVNLQSAGPALTLSNDTKKAILDATQKYVDDAVYEPLNSGSVGAGFAALFDSYVRGAATGRDEHALTESLHNASTYAASAAPIELSGLVDTTGTLLYLASNLTLHEDITTAAGHFNVDRNVELTFAPSGKTWLITAYRVDAKQSPVKPPKPRPTTTTTSKP